MKPSYDHQVLEKQSRQKQAHDQHSRESVFDINDAVAVKLNRQNQDSWQHGVIVEKLSYR